MSPRAFVASWSSSLRNAEATTASITRQCPNTAALNRGPRSMAKHSPDRTVRVTVAECVPARTGRDRSRPDRLVPHEPDRSPPRLSQASRHPVEPRLVDEHLDLDVLEPAREPPRPA